MTATYTKVCSTQRKFNNELFVYQSAFPDKPKLLEILAPRTLILEKVEAIPYLDVPEFTEEMAVKLAQTIARLHSVARLDDEVLCHWDNQPKNILWSEHKRKFYLVDFEDIRLNYPEADLTHLFLFWADTSDLDCLYSKLCIFLHEYSVLINIKSATWKRAIRNAIGRFDARRRRFGKSLSSGKSNQKEYRDCLSRILELF